MKTKHNQFLRLLSRSVFVAASVPFVAQAAIFFDDTAGDANPTAADNGANTILADGGTSSAPKVNVIGGVSMTGDAGEGAVVVISSANYTLTNAGNLSGTNHHGVSANTSFTLVNSGTISGGTTGGRRGVVATFATITNNGGLITGTDDGIHFTSDGGTVTNSGTISGTTSSISDGIRGRNNLVVNNSGLISGVQYGIYANGNVTVDNYANGTITAGNEDAVRLDGNGGTVTNYGSIIAAGNASADGVRGQTGLTVYNNTNFNIYSNPVSGGSITGRQYGILAGDSLTVVNENLASITGGVHGINAGNSANITNDAGGTIDGNGGNGINVGSSLTLVNGGLIEGSSNGVSAGNSASVTNYWGGTITGTNTRGITAGNSVSVTNSGSISGGISGVLVLDNGSITNNSGAYITGTSNDGITAGDFANIINGGTISGGLHGVYLVNPTSSTITNYQGGLISGGFQGIQGDAGVDTVTNSGTIAGPTNAIQLSGGANVINLNDGSIINGNISASGGSNVITMSGGQTSTGDSTGNVINGNVNDTTSLSKTGSGMAAINGNVSADTVSVTGGALFIRGNMTNVAGGENSVGVNAAWLGGTGTWDSAVNLVSGSVISPGTNPLWLATTTSTSVGTVTVTGDVDLSSNSAYHWNAIPGGASDVIQLTGAGNQFNAGNATFAISPTNVNAPLHDGTVTVVDTASALIGSFGDISLATFPATTPDTGMFEANLLDPILIENFTSLNSADSNRDWQLTIAHDYGQFGRTPNEVAAGDMLSGLVNTATGDVADLLAALDYSDAQMTVETLAALDPGAYLATVVGLASNNYHLHRTVESHNAAVRAGAGAVPMPAAEPSAKGAEVAAPAPAGCAGTRNVWGLFAYDWQDLTTGNSAFDQDGETASFAAGVDFTVAANFRLGLVAEGSQSEWDGNGALGSSIDSYRIAAYANWGAATGWFVDALIGYNNHSVDQSRLAGIGNILGVQSGSYDVDGWQGLVNVGHTFNTSAGLISPFLGLEMQQLEADSINAVGTPIPVSVGSFDIDSIRAMLGVKWSMEIARNLRAYAALAYAFEFQGDAPAATVGFGGGSYRAIGQDLGDSVLVSGGLLWNVANCLTLDFGYRGEIAVDDGLDSHGASIGLNYSF